MSNHAQKCKEGGNSMSNFGKFVAALALGLMLSLSLLLTSSFAHTANHSTATQVAATNAPVTAHVAHWGGGFGDFGGFGGFGGFDDCCCGGWGW
jgi:hypothetical protein